jgi:hypothetical protein
MPIENILGRRDAERKERMRNIAEGAAPAKVRVTPTRDELRKVLRHPANNIPFGKTGSVEWPNDQFTKRRVRDGDVTVEARKPTDEQVKTRGGGQVGGPSTSTSKARAQSNIPRRTETAMAETQERTGQASSQTDKPRTAQAAPKDVVG